MLRCITLILVIITGSALAQQTVIYNCTKHASIHSHEADIVHNNDPDLLAAAWTFNGNFGAIRSLFSFEICPPASSFTLYKAEIKLYHNATSVYTGHTTNGLNGAVLYRIQDNWDDSTVTWNNQPSVDSTMLVSLQPAQSGNQNYSINVTAIVDSMMRTGNQEMGFYLQLSDEQYYRSLVFCSNDHLYPNLRPQLVLSYTADSALCTGAPIHGFPTTNDEPNCPIQIPNIITPNGDGINDFFQVDSICHTTAFTCTIYNRWGNILFTSQDPGFKWYGEQVEDGTYFYIIQYKPGNKMRFSKGSLTVLHN